MEKKKVTTSLQIRKERQDPINSCLIMHFEKSVGVFVSLRGCRLSNSV